MPTYGMFLLGFFLLAHVLNTNISCLNFKSVNIQAFYTINMPCLNFKTLCLSVDTWLLLYVESTLYRTHRIVHS